METRPPRGNKLDISSDWTIQLAASELDDTWRTALGPTRIQLPVFRMKKRNFSNVGDWTQPDCSDAEWNSIHVLRGSGLFTDHSSILLRTTLPPGAPAEPQDRKPSGILGPAYLWLER